MSKFLLDQQIEGLLLISVFDEDFLGNVLVETLDVVLFLPLDDGKDQKHIFRLRHQFLDEQLLDE